MEESTVEKDNTCIISQRGSGLSVFGPDDTWTNVWAFEVGERVYIESNIP